MDSCLKGAELYTESVEKYKIHVDEAIVSILSNEERLVFAIVVEKARITPYIINQYPELRNYVLESMKYHKEIHVMDKKINKAINSLTKGNKTITFLAIMKKCKIGLDNAYHNEIIKDKIRDAIIKSKQVPLIENILK